MASGKTTFGKALARRLGYNFIDLDFYIEQRFRARIPEIFASRGESGFRSIESAMLREAGEFDCTVVSCGGGTPCQGDNMDYMLGRGLTVTLDASVERTVDRLLRAAGKRPLVAGISPEELPAFVASHKQERAPHYDRSQIRFQSDQLEDRRQISSSVERFLQECREHGIKLEMTE